MERFFFRAICLVTVLTVAFSCSKEIDVVADGGIKNVVFNTEEIHTRTYFGEKDGTKYPILWNGNEALKVSLNEDKLVDATANTTQGSSTASFSADVVETTSESYTFYAFCPGGGFSNISNTYHSINATIPTVQNSTASSCDPSAQLIYAVSPKLDDFPTEAVTLSFDHATAYGCVTLTGLPTGTVVKKLTVTANENIAGTGYFYYADYDDTYKQGSWKNYGSSGSATIVINVSENQSPIWFGCRPTTNLQSLKFDVEATDANGNTVSYTKTSTITGHNFETGKVAKMSVSGFSSASSTVYARTTAVSVNDKIILVGENISSKSFFAAGECNGTILSSVSINSPENDIVTITTENVNVMTVGGTAGANTLSLSLNDNKNLSCDNSGNYVQVDGNSNTWSLFVEPDGSSSFASVAYSQRSIRYNASSPRFATYTNAQNNAKIYIYKQVTGTPVPEVATSGLSDITTSGVKVSGFSIHGTPTTSGVEYKAQGESSWTSVEAASASSSFNVTLQNLSDNTTYSVRAYVVIDNTTYRGQELSFTTASASTTVLWSETWGTKIGDDVSVSAYDQSGTTTYNNASITYSASSSSTKLYAEKLAGGESPELLIAKSGGSLTVNGIPTGGKTNLTLIFLSNKTTFSLSSTNSAITISGGGKEWTITNNNSSVTSFDLTIKNTGSSNARIDNISLVGE